MDPALGFCAGINFFALQAVLVPFEVTAFNIVLRFWTDEIPTVAVISIVLGTYACVSFEIDVQMIWFLRITMQDLEYVCGPVVWRCVTNIFAILTPDSPYIESEFWLSIGKATLAVGLMAFTFITMVGGNPSHDKYGFRNWDRVYYSRTIFFHCSIADGCTASKVSGAPFAEFIKTGSLGRFHGFLACLIHASFTIAGKYSSFAKATSDILMYRQGRNMWLWLLEKLGYHAKICPMLLTACFSV